MSSLSNKVDVLVVGAGPTGLLAALELARAGIEVEVIDRAWRSAAQSYACGLHGASLGHLAALGLDGPLREAGMPVETLAFYAGADRQADVHFGGAQNPDQGLLVVPQDKLEEILEEALRELGVRVRWGHRFDDCRQDDTAVFAGVEKLGLTSVGYPVARSEEMVESDVEVHARYLIGADGADSHVRQMLNIPTRTLGACSSHDVLEFEPERPGAVGREVRVAVGSNTVDVLWPQPASTCRWSLEFAGTSEEHPHKERSAYVVLNAVSDGAERERMESLIRSRAPWFEAGVREIDWSTVVRFDRMVAERFGRGRVWLAGDAGHQTGPVGMQSMNVGLREASDLARRLVRILRAGESTALLDAYDSERRVEWGFLLGSTGGLVAKPDTRGWVAAQRRRLLPCLPASGSALTALAGQLGLKVEA